MLANSCKIIQMKLNVSAQICPATRHKVSIEKQSVVGAGKLHKKNRKLY
jgi:hypothetical protein